LGLGLAQKGGKCGYPFRECRKENPQGPVILKMGKGFIYSLLGHFSSFP